VFIVWSNFALLITGKREPAEGFGIAISPKTKDWVTSGPYKYTRNPMVFGVYSIDLSLAWFLNVYMGLILVLMVLPAIIVYLKKSEENRFHLFISF